MALYKLFKSEYVGGTLFKLKYSYSLTYNEKLNEINNAFIIAARLGLSSPLSHLTSAGAEDRS